MRLLARAFTLLGKWAPLLVGSFLIHMGVAYAAPAPTSVEGVYNVTYLDVAANSVTQGIALLKDYREASRHEAGNLEFTVLQETIRPNRFVIFEGWQDKAASDAHMKAASASKFQEALKPMRNSPPYQMTPYYPFVTAPARAKPGRGAVYMVEHMDFMPTYATSALPLVKEMAEATQKEEGLIRYDVYHWGDHHYEVVAIWPNRKAYDAHEAAAYTRKFRDTTAVPGGRIDLWEERLYQPI
jgi:quinol monooxygenase YgiN